MDIISSLSYRLVLLLIIEISINLPAQQFDAGLENIKAESLLKTVNRLTSAEFDGRLPGSDGYNKAAKYAAQLFETYGLTPAGDEGFFQYLNVEYNRIDTPVVFNILMDGNKLPYILGRDFVFRGFSGAANLTLPVAFCGYGISRPDLGYDDYAKVDVRNKVALVFKQNPSWKINEEPWGNDSPREKSRVAYEHGAKGMLFVSLPNDQFPQPLIGSVMHGEGEQLDSFPQLHISPEVANDFLSLVNVSINDCQTRIDQNKSPYSFLTERSAEIFVNTKYEKSARTINVVGELKGTDPGLKNEYLIIGAHLDHVGSQAGLLFPGANDNASGSAGVLQLAKAFKSSQFKPKRRVIFVLFASEEQGLFGSKHFVDNMKVKPENVIAMFNLDCVGYGDSIQVGNGKSVPDLWMIADSLDEENSNLMVKDTWKGGGADATAFHEKGIPCLYFVSKYSYNHLHLPSDTAETLNPTLFENIVKLAYLTVREVADCNYEREKTID